MKLNNFFERLQIGSFCFFLGLMSASVIDDRKYTYFLAGISLVISVLSSGTSVYMKEKKAKE